MFKFQYFVDMLNPLCVDVYVSGFINIDCGIPASSRYVESTSKLNYISDASFINSGISKNVLDSKLQEEYQRQLWSLRSFPLRIRNCYKINVIRGSRYLIRASFLYGNYDGLNSFPIFDLYLGANLWDIVQINDASDVENYEIINIPALDYVKICLVNTSLGTPFISSIELRPLNNDMYVTEFGSLALWKRVDLGSTKSYSYPDDVYDRIWTTDWDESEKIYWKTLSVSIPTGNLENNDFQPPEIVMSTLVTPANASAPLKLSWTPPNTSNQYYVYLHFSELQELAQNETRSFNITLNGQIRSKYIVPDYLGVTTTYTTSAISREKFEYLLVKTENSTLPPILNAIEIYIVKEFPLPETNQEDVDAITSIQSTYGLTKNWQGDPCNPVQFLWDGINCTYDDGQNSPRITTLDFSNNSLNGEVPAFLSQLEFLKILNLESNNFSGSLLSELIEKSNRGTLSIRVLGKGGFGTVYLGFIDDNLVAAKMLSPSSAQGYQQFQAEVKLLMTVHHRNLTSLVGYCNEENNKGLIYEYMANGNLRKHLSGKHNKAKFLTWEDRLRISIDAAQGLEYLHNGCKPPIIHRDIKFTNILLNEHFQAKLSDFGLSKTMAPPTEGRTQLSSVVGGTPGYIDPEFYRTSRLTDKSDIYSFGVVLLELITNQQPVMVRNHEQIHISQWVSSLVENGDIKKIVYSRLHGEFDSNSVWKAVELAMACLSPNANRRPTMNEVVIELKECLATALSRTNQSDVSETRLEEQPMVNMFTETPHPR
ncbi:hypothetical protein L6164_028809 [Bauhinia variegata]|uniref:Uncharacterized protein n=1 Tax=Bauhinia variegata TaxID=167791 RepID=A0ACB9L7R5_BAUVA|nr:hypothetical protein L6164_028809 [Bauhinia variegata]